MNVSLVRGARLLVHFLLLFSIISCSPVQEIQKISRFGEYEGYSEARFEEWITTSQYVPVRDGTRLSVDVVRPAVNGVAVDEGFPVIWTHSRYHRNPMALARRSTENDSGGGEQREPDLPEPGSTRSFVDGNPTLTRLLRHGYVFVAAAVRGSGASFGRYEGLFSPAETRDAYDVMDWISKQSWCDGNLGMWGASYLGITQYMAASVQHPALKAILPVVSLFDFYDALYPGGVYRDDLVQHWGILTRRLDTEMLASPVSNDPTGQLRDQAIAEHAGNWDVIPGLGAAEYRDSYGGEFSYATHGPTPVLKAINASNVAAYHWGGWFDAFTLDEFLWYANYKGPQKLTVGPWSHTSQGQPSAAERGRLMAVEHHRWFDYWLKGIDNGIMDEPPIHYSLVDNQDVWTWTSAQSWPPANVQVVDYYLAGGASGSVASVNDGILSRQAPEEPLTVEYRVDPTTSSGTHTRWDNAVGQGPMVYPDLAANDAKALTWTTPPLESELRVVGHPVVSLYLTSSTHDADLHVLLEEVDSSGAADYVTEGILRASHRQTTEAPWNNLGLPYQRSRSEDSDPLPNTPVRIQMDLIPTARLFNIGNRLRITVMGADEDNTAPIPATESPTIQIYLDPEHPSKVEVPVAGATG